MGEQARRDDKNLNERRERDKGDNWEEDRDQMMARQGPEHPG